MSRGFQLQGADQTIVVIGGSFVAENFFLNNQYYFSEAI
jgi:hypothetical protein